MVVADNRAYKYQDLDYLSDLHKEQVKKQAPKPKKSHRPKQHIFSILVIFSVCLFMLSRQAYIAEINFKISKLESSYKQALKENTELNVQLMQKVNLEELEKNATERLGMQYPEPQQFAYVEVPKTISVDRKPSEYVREEQIQENIYIGKIKGFINNIVKILE